VVPFLAAVTSGQLLFLAQLIYALSLGLALLKQNNALTFWVMTLGAVLNGFALAWHYWHSWPMMPMYIGLPALLFCLAVIWLIGFHQRLADSGRIENLIIQGLIVFLGLITLLFPKDFYLPFLRSATIWSHIFLITGIMAKALLLMAAIKALLFLIYRHNKKITSRQGLASAMPWAISGFVCLTLSMFSGEVWSYLGWGTPVVWHDPAITTVMAIWFYWIALLHLHYTRSWNEAQRAIFMMIGGLLVILFACHPDMGPFRLPFKELF
jgi:hypothetical protein